MKGGSRAGQCVRACLALAALTGSPAHAQYDDQPLPTWYVGPMVGYGFADGDRNAKDGLNLHLVAGRVIHDAFAVELNAFTTKFDTNVAGGPDTDLTGLGANLALGLSAGGHPVFLLGAGTVQQDIGGESRTSTFGDLGVGVYLPFSVAGELWRLDARYHVLMTDHPALPGEEIVEDLRLNFGVLFGFGREQPPPQPPAQEEVIPPPPVDGDGDGVPDAADQCPDTAAGAAVDASGCELRPVAAPADGDGDGVADASDACPGTTPGTKVDAKGCVIPEKVVMRAAYFGSNSASLTAKGYEMLHEIAAALKANPGLRFEIEGHSDMSGPADQNLVLSQKRAELVRDVLVELGIDPGRLVAKGYGETRPVNDNKTLEKRAQNRRVEFRRLDASP